MQFQLAAFADESSSDILKQVDALKRNGYSFLEIRSVGEESYQELTLEETKELAKILADNGIAIQSLGSNIGKIQIDGDFDAHMEVYKHALEQGNIFGADKIRLFSFFLPENEDPAKFKNLVLDRMGLIAETAKQFGIKACHENEKGIYGAVASRCLEIHQAVPELGGIFDPANYVQCGQDTLEAWEMLKSYITYMHIKDAKLDGTVVLPGTGDGNVPEIIAKYVAQGGKLFTLEPHLSEFVGLSELEQAGNKSLVGHMTFATPEEAFDAAAQNLVKILNQL